MRTFVFLLILAAMAPAQAGWFWAQGDPLERSAWHVTSLEGRKVQGELTLQFGDDGRLMGRTGVNSISGSYRIEGSSLHIGPCAMTRMAGPPELMDQESRMTSALDKVDGFKRRGSELTLLSMGAVVMKRRQRDAD